MEQEGCLKLTECLNSGRRKIGQRLRIAAGNAAGTHIIKGTVIICRFSDKPGTGKSASVCLVSATSIDPNTRKGKLSHRASLRGREGTEHSVSYRVTFRIDADFGLPGALLMRNGHRRHEFFLDSVTLDAPGGRLIHFECRSWVYPIAKTGCDRTFFANKSYLPGDTPAGLIELRREELASLRGDGTGERKEWERIYDYDRYNDLGDPDRGQAHARPVLGGSKAHPYPRRGRTGRQPSNKDPMTESRRGFVDLSLYVPPDDRFSPNKMSDFILESVKAILHFVVPEVKSLFNSNHGNFESFDQIIGLYEEERRTSDSENWLIKHLQPLLPKELFDVAIRASKANHLKFPLPQVIMENKRAWKDDAEFAREMLSGTNPVVIQLLKTFPPGNTSRITASHVERNLDGLTVDTAMRERRLFVLDHHDYLMPYLTRINSQPGVFAYASRTLLFLKDDGTLKPIAIELSLPGDGGDGGEVSKVFMPARYGTDRALWELAKAHVSANDSGHHQLISHWLRTHAVIEPFVIATRRHLSTMHPVYKLLDPHFKDTMHVNALARGLLVNADGVLERTMFPGKYSMELSSEFYRDWRFDEQGLPADLLKRGMALEDPDKPCGIRLVIKDYPYAVDGLEIWAAIERWVHGFIRRYYPGNGSVASDAELQSWWIEVRNVGHGDLPLGHLPHALDTVSGLASAVTVIVWIASALHASVNFGQYAYAGYIPNRPIKCRRAVPDEGALGFAEFMRDPDAYYLGALPDRLYATLGIALIEVLSAHMAGEEYLGGRRGRGGEWTDDEAVRKLYEEFAAELRGVEQNIGKRNADPTLGNRRGPAAVPYTLMHPDVGNDGSVKGITNRGIPNSVSI
ncbi:putative linoleate 9S-lipoxygenase 5 [Acorus calamus]|uniref:Lipoxygenase n=1 Tax=Acorus calamus TaxID=4465 RepID=A0AAV9CR47_ACOCL|nr:putative linoleate 9S-lipoxygenase 5 [Acorus calamus]